MLYSRNQSETDFRFAAEAVIRHVFSDFSRYLRTTDHRPHASFYMDI